MNKLNLLKLGAKLTFTDDTRLPPFIGNTLRGAFGYALKKSGCAYDAVFKVEGGTSAPNPFVVSSPYPSKGLYRAGDALEFSLTLIGSACAYKDEAMKAIRGMCLGKLEHAEAAASVIYDREWNDRHADTIPRCGQLALRFVSPTEILSSKSAVSELGFSAFIDSLFGRIAGLIDNYTDGEFVLPYSMVADKPLASAEQDITPVRFQTNGQPIEGFTGTVRYAGDVTRYLPYIDLGSQIHAGKKTTRGCGRYVFEI